MRAAILTLLIAAFATACDHAAGPDAGRLTGRLDGVTWNGPAVMGIGPLDGAVLMSEMHTGTVRRRIWVDLNHGSAGTYAIPEGGAVYESDGPGTGGDPFVATATGGTLVITRIDEGAVEGFLDVTFGSGVNALRFRDGVFRAEWGPTGL